MKSVIVCARLFLRLRFFLVFFHLFHIEANFTSNVLFEAPEMRYTPVLLNFMVFLFSFNFVFYCPFVDFMLWILLKTNNMHNFVSIE